MHIGHLLTRAALRWPERPAWLQDERVITFRQAEARVNRLAHALAQLGATPGDRIGMLLPNCSQGLETLLAPMKGGMAVVPMNIRLHPDEHVYMLNDAGTRILIYGEEFRPHLDTMRGRLTTVTHAICVGAPARGDLPFEEIMQGQPDTPPPGAIEPDDLAWLFYTSGTTGRPKGASRTGRAARCFTTLPGARRVPFPPRGRLIRPPSSKPYSVIASPPCSWPPRWSIC